MLIVYKNALKDFVSNLSQKEIFQNISETANMCACAGLHTNLKFLLISCAFFPL